MSRLGFSYVNFQSRKQSTTLNILYGVCQQSFEIIAKCNTAKALITSKRFISCEMMSGRVVNCSTKVLQLAPPLHILGGVYKHGKLIICVLTVVFVMRLLFSNKSLVSKCSMCII